METFPTEDRSKDVRDLDLRCDSLPALRSLGVFWDLETDAFTFEVSLPEKPFTRGGVLSIVNSVYDPLGFMAPVMLNEEKVKKFVTESGCEWELNPPHASHFGGVWERQINTIRRVLDAMFAELGRTQLTHELLITLMAEVVAIVNARPITALPSDPDDP